MKNFFLYFLLALSLSSQSQTYDLWSIDRNSRDTTYMKAYTDSLFHKDAGVYSFIGFTNIQRATPWYQVNHLPLMLADTMRLNNMLDSIQFYNASGRIRKKMKEWNGIVTPSGASGYSVDISSAGFTSIYTIQVTAGSNSSSALTIPFASIKSYTTSAVSINLEIPGAAIPIPTGTLTGYTLFLTVKGE